MITRFIMTERIGYTDDLDPSVVESSIQPRILIRTILAISRTMKQKITIIKVYTIWLNIVML